MVSKISYKLFSVSVSLLLSFSLNSMVQPKKRSLKNTSFKAAGVLPYTRWAPKTRGGDAYFLAAREKSGPDAGTYDAFGGKRDAGEQHPIQTAAREFVEETLGLLGGETTITQAIDPAITNNTKYILARDSKGYVLYMSKFPADKLELLAKAFYKLLYNQPAVRRHSEKDALRWVKWSDLEKAMKVAQPGKAVWVSATKVDKSTGGLQIGTIGIPVTEMIQIRPILTAMVRPLFQNERFEEGKNPKIRFYQ
jgi:8-oxo-dGTP pyrophosphatase MutT (NUDIX family)